MSWMHGRELKNKGQYSGFKYHNNQRSRVLLEWIKEKGVIPKSQKVEKTQVVDEKIQQRKMLITSSLIIQIGK